MRFSRIFVLVALFVLLLCTSPQEVEAFVFTEWCKRVFLTPPPVTAVATKAVKAAVRKLAPVTKSGKVVESVAPQTKSDKLSKTINNLAPAKKPVKAVKRVSPATKEPAIEAVGASVKPLALPVKAVIKQLHRLRNAKMAASKERFSAGKTFLGVHSAMLFELAKTLCEDGGFSEADAWTVMDSPYNEQRWVAVRMLAHRFEVAGGMIRDTAAYSPQAVSAAKELRVNIANEFVNRIPAQIDNWNLVDAGALPILGGQAVATDEGRKLLYELAKSDVDLKRRAAVRAAEAFVDEKKFADVEAITLMLLHDPLGRVRAVVGALLQRAGRQDEKFLTEFLEKYANVMPRAMLSSAMSELPLELQKRLEEISGRKKLVFPTRKKRHLKKTVR